MIGFYQYLDEKCIFEYLDSSDNIDELLGNARGSSFRRSDPYYQQPPDDIATAHQSGDLRKLIELWKTAKSQSDKKGQRRAAAAMKEVAPDWFDSQVRKARG